MAGVTRMQGAGLAGDRFWLCLFAGYFLLHVVLRLLTGGALGLDEAEIYLDARHLAWGYGPQLPLYAWLQWAVFQLTGPGLAGLAVLKNLLLFATVATLYATLRSRHAPRAAGLASLSLLMLYQISWESQRALTHSVLASLCAVLTLWAVWRILRRPGPKGFLLLGLVLAAGGLSKYNYLVMVVAIFLAALSHPDTRRPLLSPWLLLSLGVALALVARPMLWIRNNPDLAFASAYKLEMAGEQGMLGQAVAGLGSLAFAVLGFCSVLLLVAAILWLVFRRQGRAEPAGDLSGLMARTILWSLILLAIGLLASGSTNIKDRWLQPMLIFAGPVVTLWLLPRIGERGARRFGQICAGLAGLIFVAMVHHNTAGDAKRAAPFAELTPQILAQMPAGAAIVAPDWIAGNMAYAAAAAPIHSNRNPPPDAALVRVWDAQEDDIPADVDPGAVITLSAPYRFDADSRLALSFARVLR